VIDREAFSEKIYAVGPATDELQEEVHDVLDRRFHAHVAAHPKAGGYVGIEIRTPPPSESAGDLDLGEGDGEIVYHYFGTNCARLLAAHLTAAAGKADTYGGRQ